MQPMSNHSVADDSEPGRDGIDGDLASFGEYLGNPLGGNKQRWVDNLPSFLPQPTIPWSIIRQLQLCCAIQNGVCEYCADKAYITMVEFCLQFCLNKRN